MDTQEYISSGIIEMYVLGLATEEESKELLRRAEECPEVLAALTSTQQGLDGLTDAAAVPPPAELKGKIAKELFPQEATLATVNPIAITPDMPAAAVKPPVNTTQSFQWKWLAAASIAFLVASLGGNIYLYYQNNSYQATIAGMEENNKRLATENQTYLTNLQTTQNELAVVMTPDTKQIPMSGVASHEAAKAMIYWNRKTSEVYLSVTDLPPAPAGMQYQLWAIVDGKPVDAGMYDATNAAALHKMKQIPNAQMFAMTLEKEGGSPAPTLTEMYVAGKV